MTLYLSETDHLNTFRSGHSNDMAATLHRIELMIRIRQTLATFDTLATGALASVPIFDLNLGECCHLHVKTAAHQSVGVGRQFHDEAQTL